MFPTVKESRVPGDTHSKNTVDARCRSINNQFVTAYVREYFNLDYGTLEPIRAHHYSNHL